ncbi:hypothetical protein E5161_07410 [Cohnella pontilimi]|uniref:Uncharacterized protein n=1 Tax=Cohnella pontilimi TaxID=2564100 RepID=A0A4V5LSH0_9BACL|nr:hypothetical protein [Cohnella pontilimi]TJY42669.1 hypothetical protein E5161_07410 [Cohnella pontilimi]
MQQQRLHNQVGDNTLKPLWFKVFFILVPGNGNWHAPCMKPIFGGVSTIETSLSILMPWLKILRSTEIFSTGCHIALLWLVVMSHDH